MNTPLTDQQIDGIDATLQAEALFDDGVTWLLCRRTGARNWIEQPRSDAVAWIARAIREGATVKSSGTDCRVKAGDVTFVFRPHAVAAAQSGSGR